MSYELSRYPEADFAEERVEVGCAVGTHDSRLTTHD
jgi:hypothetical protein